MRRKYELIAAAGLVLAILISNTVGFVRDGLALDRLRGSVLRLHILAESDSERDQTLKLYVRDALLESGILGEADSLAEAEAIAADRLPDIERIAETVLRANGCELPVEAELADTEFDVRTYGDITMPAGTYRALRVKIGSARGHNWWCVMYPSLCVPAACDVTDNKQEELGRFDGEELDILYEPQKYEVRFAIWDKIKEIGKAVVVHCDENDGDA
ncbi:stage II sporulation protein R [Ruminococcus sp. YRD2003]|uniref:stage II sporulation protein R n=1 Tax=Ruminococcus sp. YRD2003 TaxID=1452313 RepID=UPI0008CC81B9|nr:stage II sporulation protein R [Ruminococcus flavefaciens]